MKKKERLKCGGRDKNKIVTVKKVNGKLTTSIFKGPLQSDPY